MIIGFLFGGGEKVLEMGGGASCTTLGMCLMLLNT